MNTNRIPAKNNIGKVDPVNPNANDASPAAFVIVSKYIVLKKQYLIPSSPDENNIARKLTTIEIKVIVKTTKILAKNIVILEDSLHLVKNKLSFWVIILSLKIIVKEKRNISFLLQ